MKRLTTREQIIFVVCLFLVFIYLGYQLGVKPLNEKVAFIKTKIEAEERKLGKHLAVLGNTSTLEEVYQVYLSHFKQSKSNEQVMSSMVSEIEDVASELSLRISDLKPKRVKTDQYSNHFSVSLTLESSLPDIIHFMHKLQNQPYLLAVEEFRFDKSARAEAATIKTQLVLSKTLIP